MIDSIIVNKNKIKKVNRDNVFISGNTIKFISNCEYVLDIVLSDNIDLDIIVEDNVCVKLFIFCKGCSIKNKILYKLGNSSNLILFKFYNNMRVDSYEEIVLSGKYSKISYNFSLISSVEDNYKIKIFHNNNYVSSCISNRCIGLDNSVVRFDIDSILDKGNVGCVMDQDTKVMCMGDVVADIKPNMYIEEDDVEARHGSVIGKFSDDVKFYLMSRGILEEEAIKLLVKGFLMSNLVVDMDSSDKVIDAINDCLDYN